MVQDLPQRPGWYVISPEGDKSDNSSYQVPVDIADISFTDNTTLLQVIADKLTERSKSSLAFQRMFNHFDGDKNGTIDKVHPIYFNYIFISFSRKFIFLSFSFLSNVFLSFSGNACYYTQCFDITSKTHLCSNFAAIKWNKSRFIRMKVYLCLTRVDLSFSP